LLHSLFVGDVIGRGTTSAPDETAGRVIDLAVGQVVVYAGHGPGRVVAREAATPKAQEVVVLELAATLTVTLPIALAHEQLRALVSETELVSVQTTLRAGPRASESVWIKRQKATREKLASGQAIALAEIISDGAHRQRGRTARLSVSERELYLKARRLLAEEIGHARGVDTAEAEDWIAAQLDHAPVP
jgi:RNA polymerase-interacting CarD/CdnL/TRCF family regulator